MDLRGALELHRPLTAAEMRPGLLVSAVADDELGDGTLRYRTQKVIGYRRDGRPIYSVKGSSRQTWQETLIAAEIDGTALNTSVTATSIIPPAARFTLPANYFDIGKVLRINAWGRVSTFTSGTLTVDYRMGPTSNIIVWNGGAFVTVISLTNKSWRLILMMTCRAIGSATTANLMGMGDFCSSAVVGSTGGAANDVMLPDNTPAVGTGFDSTVAMVADLFATWSVSSASNSIQTHMYTLEALN
jgi:hypothetical protein